MESIFYQLEGEDDFRGPFTEQQVQAWYLMGYFYGGVRFKLDVNADARTLAQLRDLNGPQCPFSSSGIGVMKELEQMRAHLLAGQYRLEEVEMEMRELKKYVKSIEEKKSIISPPSSPHFSRAPLDRKTVSDKESVEEKSGIEEKSNPEKIPPPIFASKKSVQLAIEPSESVISTSGGTFVHSLTNNGTAKAMFKIKITNNMHYGISPVYGFVEPGQSIDIKVTRVAGPPRDDIIIIYYAKAYKGDADAVRDMKRISLRDSIVLHYSARQFPDAPLNSSFSPSLSSVVPPVLAMSTGKQIIVKTNTLRSDGPEFRTPNNFSKDTVPAVGLGFGVSKYVRPRPPRGRYTK